MTYSNDNDLALANKYIINKDYSEVFYIHRKLSDQNKVDEAMNKLGICNENGYSVNADCKMAFDWHVNVNINSKYINLAKELVIF